MLLLRCAQTVTAFTLIDMYYHGLFAGAARAWCFIKLQNVAFICVFGRGMQFRPRGYSQEPSKKETPHTRFAAASFSVQRALYPPAAVSSTVESTYKRSPRATFSRIEGSDLKNTQLSETRSQAPELPDFGHCLKLGIRVLPERFSP